MPVFLEPRDVTEELEGFSSVLIVSCPVCPPMSLAMREKQPFIEFFKHGLKTKVFEDYIAAIRAPLEARGVRTDVFSMRLPSPLMCLWTEGQHRRLRERAKGYEAVLVLGCNSATYSAQDALKGTGCQVIQAMRMKAMANATLKVRPPLTVDLEIHPLPKRRGSHRDVTPAGHGNDKETDGPERAPH